MLCQKGPDISDVCVVQTCKIEQSFALCSLEVSWSSKFTPIFLTEADDGVFVDEPN